MLAAAGKFDEAIARYERASAGFAALDDLHDEAVALGNEAIAYSEHGDHAKHREYLERAIALSSKLPHAQLLLADQLSDLSIAHLEDGHYADARAALQRALVAIGDGEDDPALLAAIHANLGLVAEREGKDATAEQKAADFATAEREYRIEVELAHDKLPADTSDLEMGWYNLGNIQRKRGELAASLESLHHAVDILQRAPLAAAESSDYAGPDVLAADLIQTQFALGHAADALADARACLAIAERDGVQPKKLADIQYWLASAIWQSGDHARGRELMSTVANEYRALHAASDVDDAEKWLAKNRL